MSSLKLYYRERCGLCDTMLSQLNRLQEQLGFSLQTVDVDRDQALRMQYNERVPVLESDQGQCLSEYFLDENRLLSYLQDD